jgi:hypothetical protein
LGALSQRTRQEYSINVCTGMLSAPLQSTCT